MFIANVVKVYLQTSGALHVNCYIDIYKLYQLLTAYVLTPPEYDIGPIESENLFWFPADFPTSG